MSKRRINRKLGVFFVPRGIFTEAARRSAVRHGLGVTRLSDGSNVVGKIGKLANWVTAEYDSEMVDQIGHVV